MVTKMTNETAWTRTPTT